MFLFSKPRISFPPIVIVPLIICFASIGMFLLGNNFKLRSPNPYTSKNFYPSPTPNKNLSPSPSGPPVLNYKVPPDWTYKTFDKYGISVCISPKWTIKQPNTIIAQKELQQVIIAQITAYDSTSSGLLVNNYLSRKYTPQQIIQKTPQSLIDQFQLNELPAVFISIPDSEDVLIVPLKDKIYEFTAGDWKAIYDSVDKFQNDFYTMVSCLKAN